MPPRAAAHPEAKDLVRRASSRTPLLYTYEQVHTYTYGVGRGSILLLLYCTVLLD